MSLYTDAAPNVSKLKSESEFMSDFPEPAPPSEPVPEPNASKKVALYNAYMAEFNSCGGVVALSRLARRMHVPPNWCRIIDREVKAAMAVVYAPVEP